MLKPVQHDELRTRNQRISSRDAVFLAQLRQLLQHHLPFQPRQMIDEQYPLEMVHIVAGRSTSAYWSGTERQPSL